MAKSPGDADSDSPLAAPAQRNRSVVRECWGCGNQPINVDEVVAVESLSTWGLGLRQYRQHA